MLNLLDNAVRHSPEGTAIRIAAVRRGQDVQVVVANEGPIQDAVERVITSLRRRKADGLSGAAAQR